MDIEDFIKQVQPRKKRSRLLPFVDQIMRLKAQGYTDLQIRDWLASNDVVVSREAVRKFITKMSTSTPVPTAQPKSPSPTTVGATSQADKMRKKLAEQKKDASSKLFKHDKTGKT